MSNQNNIFEKPPLSIDDQLERLSSRGVIMQDEDTARHHLSYISYYRFCGYAIEFEDGLVNGEKQYRNGTTFEQILDCYVFDRKLRLLVIDAIERIEIAEAVTRPTMRFVPRKTLEQQDVLLLLEELKNEIKKFTQDLTQSTCGYIRKITNS